ncbi:NUDIX hydrolase [Acrocarpospora pleiomorpha]|nr:NUDIX domain-containing protein [Acrocarpospora pleiomorpha]
MMAPPLRPAARVIALDDDDNVLLRYDENGGFWATPGGSLDSGEDYPTAVRRELREELGVDDAQVRLGAQIAERSKIHQVGGHDVRQVEKYYLAHLAATAINPARATQPDTTRARRWWTLDELRDTRETIYPLGLANLIAEIRAAGVPDTPVVLR